MLKGITTLPTIVVIPATRYLQPTIGYYRVTGSAYISQSGDFPKKEILMADINGSHD
jgi:hypothetical protein